ncbi:MAG: hypothetical protein ABWW69_06125 [Pyrodictiaceae archaeon]
MAKNLSRRYKSLHSAYSAVILVLISALTLYTLYSAVLIGMASSSTFTINLYKATLGPIYHKTPEGQLIEIYAEVTYPDTLLYFGQGPYLYPPIKVRLYCNWSAWGATVVVGVLDSNYTIDPTTLKPAEWGMKWASGGCTIGPGAEIYASKDFYSKSSAICEVNLSASSRLLSSPAGAARGLRYFFKISISLYDSDTGSVIPGGYVYMYTNSTSSPETNIDLYPAKGNIIISNNRIIISQPSAKSYNPLIGLVLIVWGISVIIGLIVYIYTHRLRS